MKSTCLKLSSDTFFFYKHHHHIASPFPSPIKPDSIPSPLEKITQARNSEAEKRSEGEAESESESEVLGEERKRWSGSRETRRTGREKGNIGPNYHEDDDDDEKSGFSHYYIVYFIPGNPGLISYYHSFLRLLSSSVSSSPIGTSPRNVSSSLSSASSFTAARKSDGQGDGDEGERKDNDDDDDDGGKIDRVHILITGSSLAGFETSSPCPPDVGARKYGERQVRRRHRRKEDAQLATTAAAAAPSSSSSSSSSSSLLSSIISSASKIGDYYTLRAQIEITDTRIRDVIRGVSGGKNRLNGGKNIKSEKEQREGKEERSGESCKRREEEAGEVEEEKGEQVGENNDGQRPNADKYRVILVGHSVGAYIAMELMRQHRERVRKKEIMVRRMRKSRLGEMQKETRQVDSDSTSAPWSRHHYFGEQEECQQQQQPEKAQSSQHQQDNNLEEVEYDIIAAFLLTPTIVDIAQSASGKILAPLLTYIPYLPLLLSGFVKIVITLLPSWFLRMLVCIALGDDVRLASRTTFSHSVNRGADKSTNPTTSAFKIDEDGSSIDAAINATVAFLTSPSGVHQSLAMAKDEMREIGPDRWGEDVWGGSGKEEKEAMDNGYADDRMTPMAPYWASEKSSNDDLTHTTRLTRSLILYFAKQDHWVADQTRDAIMRQRGGEKRSMNMGEKMVMCGGAGRRIIVAEEGELVHGWCIRHSHKVAESVNGWLEEAIDMDQRMLGSRSDTSRTA